MSHHLTHSRKIPLMSRRQFITYRLSRSICFFATNTSQFFNFLAIPCMIFLDLCEPDLPIDLLVVAEIAEIRITNSWRAMSDFLFPNISPQPASASNNIPWANLSPWTATQPSAQWFYGDLLRLLPIAQRLCLDLSSLWGTTLAWSSSWMEPKRSTLPGKKPCHLTAQHWCRILADVNVTPHETWKNCRGSVAPQPVKLGLENNSSAHRQWWCLSNRQSTWALCQTPTNVARSLSAEAVNSKDDVSVPEVAGLLLIHTRSRLVLSFVIHAKHWYPEQAPPLRVERKRYSRSMRYFHEILCDWDVRRVLGRLLGISSATNSSCWTWLHTSTENSSKREEEHCGFHQTVGVKADTNGGGCHGVCGKRLLAGRSRSLMVLVRCTPSQTRASHTRSQGVLHFVIILRSHTCVWSASSTTNDMGSRATSMVARLGVCNGSKRVNTIQIRSLTRATNWCADHWRTPMAVTTAAFSPSMVSGTQNKAILTSLKIGVPIDELICKNRPRWLRDETQCSEDSRFRVPKTREKAVHNCLCLYLASFPVLNKPSREPSPSSSTLATPLGIFKWCWWSPPISGRPG